MYPLYKDILALTDKEPDWFDDNGVPRYAKFEPGMMDIYSKEECLLSIKCQSCGELFKVGFCWDFGMTSLYIPIEQNETAEEWAERVKKHSLKEQICAGRIHYGDAPRHDGCNGRGCAGDTMNCEDIAVLEFWEKKDFNWVRVPELEILLPDGGG